MKFDGIKRGIEIYSEACQTTDTMKIAMVLSIIRDLICVIENDAPKSDAKVMERHLDAIYARLENIEDHLGKHLPFQEDGISVAPELVPFEVAFAAMKQGKTIRHVNWNFKANLETINPCNGWMPYDLLQDAWIILD